MSTAATILPEEIHDAAAVWLSRRDRGLSAKEQDAYLEWLYADSRHGRAIVQLERVWSTLNRLEQWRPAHSAVPNPDLLAPRRPGRIWRWVATLAAAAAIMVGIYASRSSPATPASTGHQAIIHPGPERRVLEDGSIVELNAGAKIEAQFSLAERRVRLLEGEAHFIVAHNAARPFFVDTGKVSVRAVGTAFSVLLGAAEVAVLVTEGKVQVLDQVAAAAGDAGPADGRDTFLAAGQRAVISLTQAAAPTVQEVTPAEVERALSWQGMRLEFVDMPLGDVVAEFNRYNRQQITVADAATAAIVVGGNFRADNVEAFVRLLDAGFGVSAFRHEGGIVLRKTH